MYIIGNMYIVGIHLSICMKLSLFVIPIKPKDWIGLRVLWKSVEIISTLVTDFLR